MMIIFYCFPLLSTFCKLWSDYDQLIVQIDTCYCDMKCSCGWCMFSQVTHEACAASLLSARSRYCHVAMMERFVSGTHLMGHAHRSVAHTRQPFSALLCSLTAARTLSAARLITRLRSGEDGH